tara:strand:+ start:785 stop:1060 length:276 start_codon:yes stop_codon:yes gene_type:complete
MGVADLNLKRDHLRESQIREKEEPEIRNDITIPEKEENLRGGKIGVVDSWPELGIEPRTSCTQSKNHTTRPFWLCIIRESNPGQLVGNQLC